MALPAAATAVAAAMLLVAALTVAVATVTGPHIADVDVLLPPCMTNPVEYRLQGSDGCFTWSWDHHDILSVLPEYNVSSRCSTSARLISIAPYNGRKETGVYATDLRTGTTIRCKVFIDKISRIQIFHHAIKIDLDELATLRIRAFDDEDNLFSSLVGSQFLWKLVPKSDEADNVNHLVHVPLKETPLSDCGGFCGDLDTQIELEDRGFGSDLYVVKGIGIGHEIVTAQLLEPQLEHVSDMIVLTVAEAMSLDPPSPVFVTFGALIRYKLRVVRLNTSQVISLPSPYHRWYAVNSSVVEVDSLMGIARALNVGITNVVIEDTRVSGHMQTSSVHVVIPDKLCLYIMPVTNASIPLEGTTPIPSSVIWYVFPGQEYIIDVKVFSGGSVAHRIHVTENNDLKFESNTVKYWELSSLSNDAVVSHDWQSPMLLRPLSQGRGILTASLTYQRGNLEMPEVVKVMQEVNVCSKVKLIFMEEDEHFQVIRLPWAPGVYQEVELKATGGCGKTLEDYKWSSTHTSVVSVSASGSARAKSPGQSIVKVVSVFDPINYDEVVIEVAVPSSLVMLPIFPVEVVVGTQLQAAVTLKTSKGDYFDCCDAFGSFVKWKVFSKSQSFKVVNTTAKVLLSDKLPEIEASKTLYGHPCAWAYVYASGAGRAVLHAILSLESESSLQSFSGQVDLKAASSIAAYLPLVAFQVANGDQVGGYWVDLSRLHAGIQHSDATGLDELYLVPGSAMDVSLLGGPERWDQQVDFIDTVEVQGDTDLSKTDGIIVQHTQQTSSGDGKLHTIFCQTLGKFTLLFSRGNLVGDDHPVPTVSNLELSVICSFPSSISLIANEPASTLDVIEAASNADRGPGRLRISPVSVSNGCTIRIAAVGIHATRRVFANSSSLCLRWELSGCEDLARWNDTNTVEKSKGAIWERFLILQNASGLCTVRATVIGLLETIDSHLKRREYTFLEGEENALTDAILLQVVSNLTVTPESVLIFSDPEAMVNLSITGGTCFVDAVINDTQVAQIIQPPQSVECSYLILGARGVGISQVTVRDIGLSPPAVASALVKVANVDWIKIQSEEEISLMEGTTKTFDILAGTQDGWVFDSSQYAYMKIKLHLGDGVLDIVSENYSLGTVDGVIFGPSFSVRAANIGSTTVYVSVRQQSGYEILSQLIKVEVYKPLEVHPAYIYLLPGASYVLTVRGGPTFGAFLEYDSMHEGIAEVQKSSGKLSACSIGNATLRAAVYGNGGTLLCEAYGSVEVGIPSAMILNSQGDQLCVGCMMPILPSFPEGDLFSFYEICKDYRWVVEDENVLNFQMARSLPSDMYKTQQSCAGESYPCHSNDSENGFINVLIGRTAGRTKVSILMTCDIVLSGAPKTVSYNASKLLTVVSDPPLSLGTPITWVLPPYYTTSEVLPRSSDSYGKLDSGVRRSTITYSVLRTCGRNDLSKHEAISINGSRIRTTDSNHLSCIQAKDQATGRTEIASCVRIAEVAQVRVTAAESSLHTVYLAVNTKLEMTISYCDDLGYPFFDAHGVVPLDVETNYPDVVAVSMSKTDNGTHGRRESVILQAKSPGRVLVRISVYNNPRRADFMLVTVGAQLYPRNPVLYIGRYVNFTIVGDDLATPRSGQWLSGNDSILSVNSITGEGHARGEGTTLVIFEGSKLKLRTTVTVLKVEQIIVDAPAEALTNVPFPSKGYKFSIKFSDPQDYKTEATRNHIEVPFDCRVEPTFVGYAKPWSDHVSGNSYCLFFPYSPKHLLSFMSKATTKSEERKRSEGFLYISIIASLSESPNVRGSAHVLFVGGFSVPEVGKLNMTPSSNKSVITVMGNTDVELDWNLKDLLLVRPLNKLGSGIGGRVDYEVVVLGRQQFTDRIVMVLPATGQTAEIDVSYELRENTTRAGMSSVTWTAILICAFVLILTIVIFMRLLDKPDHAAAARQGGPVSPSIKGPTTPSRTSDSDIQSPRTPQPFVDYLRRTIDETPYYKRETRRFDPQYTY